MFSISLNLNFTIKRKKHKGDIDLRHRISKYLKIKYNTN